MLSRHQLGFRGFSWDSFEIYSDVGIFFFINDYFRRRLLRIFLRISLTDFSWILWDSLRLFDSPGDSRWFGEISFVCQLLWKMFCGDFCFDFLGFTASFWGY